MEEKVLRFFPHEPNNNNGKKHKQPSVHMSSSHFFPKKIVWVHSYIFSLYIVHVSTLFSMNILENAEECEAILSLTFSTTLYMQNGTWLFFGGSHTHTHEHMSCFSRRLMRAFYFPQKMWQWTCNASLHVSLWLISSCCCAFHIFYTFISHLAK